MVDLLLEVPRSLDRLVNLNGAVCQSVGEFPFVMEAGSLGDLSPEAHCKWWCWVGHSSPALQPHAQSRMGYMEAELQQLADRGVNATSCSDLQWTAYLERFLEKALHVLRVWTFSSHINSGARAASGSIQSRDLLEKRAGRLVQGSVLLS